MGVKWPVQQLTELEQAYSNQKTAIIGFTGFWDGFSAKFVYLPAGISDSGAQRTTKARFEVDTDPSKVHAMVDVVRQAFPRQRGILFISWSGAVAHGVALVLQKVFTARLPASTIVFVSSASIKPGSDPYRTMLDEHLLPASALVAVLTKDSAESAWLVWETAAAWALGRLVIPMMVDIDASAVKRPLTVVRQGGRVQDRGWLDTALTRVGALFGLPTVDPLSDEEAGVLERAAGGSP